VKLANEGLLYACDRMNNRIQVSRKMEPSLRNGFTKREVQADVGRATISALPTRARRTIAGPLAGSEKRAGEQPFLEEYHDD
jgi:hypothetical protein